jgi:hypothetical protein
VETTEAGGAEEETMRRSSLGRESAKIAVGTALCALLAMACGSADPGDGVVDPGVGPHAYRGTYEVPISPELRDAARFEVDEIEWSVIEGTARLAYKLPVGLVGTSLRVDFVGPLDLASGKGELTGEAGSSACTVGEPHVVCKETMPGLLPIEVDFDRVRKLAEREYPGPAQDRVDVATTFMNDPIGVARVDLRAPTVPGEIELEAE